MVVEDVDYDCRKIEDKDLVSLADARFPGTANSFGPGPEALLDAMWKTPIRSIGQITTALKEI